MTNIGNNEDKDSGMEKEAMRTHETLDEADREAVKSERGW